jgi:thymidylate kinase
MRDLFGESHMSMLIGVRGTSGSGKTYIANLLLTSQGLYEPPRDETFGIQVKPVCHIREPLTSDRKPLAVIGHYHSAAGGCDLFPTNNGPYKIIQRCFEAGADCFYEGLRMSIECRRVLALHQAGVPVHLFYLNTPFEVCVDGVNKRRLQRGWDLYTYEEARTKDMYKRYRTLLGHPKRWADLGLQVTVGSREDAVGWLRELGVLP